MKERCYNSKSQNYSRYGGRNITVCSNWLNSFESFAKWAFNNGYKDSLTIDRIDFNGNYTPENCKWSTIKEQANNRRSNVLITFNGETMNLLQWSERINLPYGTLYSRLYQRSWPIEKALTTPIKINQYC
jgi:hypothetical protein